MELVIVIIALLVCVGVLIYVLYERHQEQKHRPQFILYLLKVNDDGKIEIKQSPKNDIWNWRF